MQVADFLTKPLGPQIYHKLVGEAMGDECKRDITKYARRNWKEKYDEEMQKRALKENDSGWINEYVEEVHAEHVKVVPDDAQGGMLKHAFVDLIYCNCMRVGDHFTGANSITCSSVEEYMACEQHRSNLVNQVYSEDMKVEKKHYGDLVYIERSTNRTWEKYDKRV